MDDGYVLLTEKEAMWAEMLVEVLKDNAILCTTIPVYGAGLAMKAGIKERLKVYVQQTDMEKAQDLLGALFAGDNA